MQWTPVFAVDGNGITTRSQVPENIHSWTPVDAVASVSSALFAVALAILLVRGLARQRSDFGSLLLSEIRLFDVSMLTSTGLLIVALSLRSAGLVPQLGFAPYVSALLFALFVGVQAFVRIVFFASDADQQ